jgi:hypothetical protein
MTAFTFLGILLLIRAYGWIVALVGFGVVWLLRRTGHPVLGLVMTLLFTLSSLLLTASIVLNLIMFATPPKKVSPPVEERRAQ